MGELYLRSFQLLKQPGRLKSNLFPVGLMPFQNATLLLYFNVYSMKPPGHLPIIIACGAMHHISIHWLFHHANSGYICLQ
mmetsp:Transcript_18783/g.25453  ORF Transcript_18783/g.25453 Transcript_18783/m.25453 type:complete len:80 (+) Transcript_18783:147-386(+)